MIKTTVYLEEGQAAALRRAATQSGRSQAQVIRDAIARETAGAPPRVFKSHGAGRSGLPPVRDVDAALAAAGFGERKLRRDAAADRDR